MARKGWIKNSNSQQYLQLQHVMRKMEGNFTSVDMMNFLKDRWDREGLAKLLPSALTGEPVMQRRFSFKSSVVSKFLANHPEVRIVDGTVTPMVYRRKNDR